MVRAIPAPSADGANSLFRLRFGTGGGETSCGTAPSAHDTRHTHASWLLSDGIPIEAVQDQLGHESAETTRKVYAHLLPAVGVAVGRDLGPSLQGGHLAVACVEQAGPLQEGADPSDDGEV